MKYRKLRVAWSVVWSIGCLLLIMLWVRSYRVGDFMYWQCSASRVIKLSSIRGFIYFDFDSGNEILLPLHTITHRQLTAPVGNYFRDIPSVPIWFPLLAFGLAASAPWLPYRFRLRTLLIGMTVATIGLGWIVYALRR